MVYYEIAKLRERTLGNAADTTQDSLLTNCGTQADALIDRMIKTTALRSKITFLPVVPLQTPTQDIKDAATDLATAIFFLQQHNLDMYKVYREQAQQTVQTWIDEQGTNENTIVGAFF